MSNSTSLNRRRVTPSVRDLLDQLIDDEPKNQNRPTPRQTNKPRNAQLDRLYALIDRESKR